MPGNRSEYRLGPAVRAAAVALLVAAAAPLTGCKRQDDARQAAQTPTSAPARLPAYVIDPNLSSRYAEAAEFVRKFLDTCYAGDYAGYRALVGRRFTPQTQERFTAMYQALESVTVESIEPVNVPELGGEAFVVVSQISLDASKRVALRGANRRLAIVVFREEGQWRMGPAPRRLRPDAPPTDPADSSDPEQSTYFPWDADGNS